ncbi:MAG: dUTP diphosphatase [Patescibacteria group bacterium]
MNIKFKRFDKSLNIPEQKTNGAACLDLTARVNTTIPANSFGYIPLNIAIEIPEGYWGLLAARSSTHKLGLLCGNGIGIIDSDFRGNNDELNFIVYNVTNKEVIVEKGTRIAQISLVKNVELNLTEVDYLSNKDRGGIGSTGHK